MNPLTVGLAPVRRLLHRRSAPTCFVCRGRIQASDERLRLRGDTVVHRQCATYRVRTRGSTGSRVGFPG
jgi:hypothetical protein